MKHERGKIGKALLFAVLIATLAFLSFGSVSAAQQHYVNPDESIQGAIDNATAGDTIIVREDTYNESINVYKRLTIQSETGADSTIVHAANSHIFNITADYVNITGFTIEEASKKCGILISGATNCNSSNNIVSGNYQGIFLSNASQNTICYNSVLANKNCGIILADGSTYNQIIMNNASNSLKESGIYLSKSYNNEIRNNIANSNNDKGIELLSSNENIIANNTAKNNEENGIYLKDSNNNSITDNDASNNVNYHGIGLSASNNNEIRNNIAISNHQEGIGLLTSNDNIIANNTAKNNENKGIHLKNSNNNEIYLNNFVDNANNVYSNESTNVWTSQSEITYTYNGSTYTDNMGNYWGDYTGTDGNGEGLDDSPYRIDTDNDEHPLMVPWENYGASALSVFGTGAGTYPSIQGTHEGKIMPSCDIETCA